MSKLAEMLSSTKPKTSMVEKRDVFAEETGKGLEGMSAKTKKLYITDTLAQEGTEGLAGMTSKLQKTGE
jgi:hypothetical protein